MKIALIGGTGFVGSYLVDELLRQAHEPVLLVRPGSASRVEHPDRCRMVSGEVQNQEAVRATLEGCDAAIYNVGILHEHKSQGITFEALQFEGAKRTIDTAVELGVRRFILASANGVKPDGTAYQQTKYRAEQYLQSTELAWTIFRPSIIFGDPRGRMEFCTQLRDELINMPVPAPLFYDGLIPMHAGRFALAPIHVGDVARAYVTSLALPDTVSQIYPLCGPEALEWRSIIQTIARAVGKTKLALPAPAYMIKWVAALLEDFEFFPMTRDQLTMLMEGSTCDSAVLSEEFSITATRFETDTLAYLKR